MTSTSPLLRYALGLLATLLLVGCETTGRKKSESLKEPFMVRRGTPAGALLENLGEPDQKYPLAEYSVEAIVWVYKRRLGSTGKSVLTRHSGNSILRPQNRANHLYPRTSF